MLIADRREILEKSKKKKRVDYFSSLTSIVDSTETTTCNSTSSPTALVTHRE